MAQVPTLHAPTTELESQPLPYQKLDAPVTAFGGRDAAALQQATDTAVKIYGDYKELADESAANDALKKFRADNIEATNDFLDKRGGDAVQAHDGYVKDLTARKQQLLVGLSPGARRLVQPNLEAAFANALELGDAHTREQHRQASVDSSNATLDVDVRDGIAARNDPAKLQGLVEHGMGEIDKIRPLLGWDDTTTENEKTKWYSRFYGAVIGQKAAENPIAAQGLLNTVGDRLDPALRLKFEEYLKPRVDSLVVNAELEKLSKSTGPDGKPLGSEAFIDAAGKLFKDPERNFLAITRARQMAAKDEVVLSQQRATLQQYIERLQGLYRGGDLSLPIPEPEIERLFPGQAKNIIGSLKLSRMGGQMLQGFNNMTEQEIADLYRDLNSGRGKYSDEVRTYLGSKARSTAPIASRDLRDGFNTELTSEQEIGYENWVKTYKDQFGIDVLKDINTYDVRGHYLKTNGGPLSDGDQLNEFRKPNNPTFSTGSKYSGVDGFQGGEWIVGDDGKNTFIPSPTNVETMGDNGLQDYFARYRPNDVLYLPGPTESDSDVAQEKIARLKLLHQAQELYEARNKTLRDDGMGYAITNDNATRAAFANAQQTDDPKDWQKATSLATSFLRHIGASNPSPMPQGMVNGMVGAFRKAADPAGKLAAIWTVTKLGNDEIRRAALQQLMDAGLPKTLPYIVQAAGRGDENGALDLLQSSIVVHHKLSSDEHADLLRKMSPFAPYFAVYEMTTQWTHNEDYLNRGIEEATMIANVARDRPDPGGGIRAVMGDRVPLIDQNLVAAFIPRAAEGDKERLIQGFHYLRGQLIANYFLKRLPEDDSQLVEMAKATAAQESAKARWIDFKSGKDGEYALVLSSGKLLPDETGRPFVFTLDQVLELGREHRNWAVLPPGMILGYPAQYQLPGYAIDGLPQ